jgi:hypothetical protein
MDKELISKECLNKIDNIILKCLNDGYVSLDISSEINKKAFRISKALGILKLKKEPITYELTEKGIITIQDGGIEKYLKNISAEKDLDKAIKVLTSRNLKYQFFYSVILVILGFLLSFVPNELNEDKNLKEEIELLKLKYEKTLLNDSLKKQLYHKSTLILSLEKRIDSLTL